MEKGKSITVLVSLCRVPRVTTCSGFKTKLKQLFEIQNILSLRRKPGGVEIVTQNFPPSHDPVLHPGAHFI